MSRSFPRRALVSVSNKDQLAPFVQELVRLDFEILSTGGTRRFLEEHRIDVIDVASYTGFPEIMSGRVKTLHPKIYAAILGRPHLADDQSVMEEHGVVPFELVVCNLYPFEQTIAKPGCTTAEAVEQIDIGGPSMVRAAAKNHASTGIVTCPSQYARVLEELANGSLGDSFRQHLAAAAFEMTARYDRAIADFFASLSTNSEDSFPETFHVNLQRRAKLRYGENPHQQAAFYVEPNASAATLAGCEQLHGKDLSYNNLLDLDAALSIVREFSTPTAMVIKHNNPCGGGTAETLLEAFQKAYDGDPLSAFGSIIGFNRPLDIAVAEELCKPHRFVEAIVAPEYDDDAYRALTTQPKWKKNVRLMQCPALNEPRPASFELRRVTGGMLIQDRDEQPDPSSEWKCVTERNPTAAELSDLTFAWLIAKHVKSNAIVFAKNGGLVGVGAGQMSRLDSVFLAKHKADGRSQKAVLASDAFFPFRDGLDLAARAGIMAVIQPGGSVRDDDVIAAANEHKIAMLFTGRRHFKH